jgi:predicted enzyme related to lactoylglutathione lyase
MRISIVLDCSDPDALAPFWMEALGYRDTGWTTEPYRVLASEDRSGPVFILQRVTEPRSGKNRMHIDLHPPDVEAEAMRLEGLGARRLGAGEVTETGVTWIVMADPEGNEFCLVAGGSGA